MPQRRPKEIVPTHGAISPLMCHLLRRNYNPQQGAGKKSIAACYAIRNDTTNEVSFIMGGGEVTSTSTPYWDDYSSVSSCEL